jgi:sugar phosphate isomerase/epimerase
MNKYGLSLISQPSYTKVSLDRIKDLGFSYISVTPQQLGLLDSDISITSERLAGLKYAQSIGLEIHSIQGLFFGISPDSDNLKDLLDHRLSRLAQCASQLSIPNAVLGSPDFRKSTNTWSILINSVSTFQHSFKNGVHIENICKGTPTCDVATNFPNKQGLPQALYMLDVSNLLSCDHVPIESFSKVVTSNFCHVSFEHHQMPRNKVDFDQTLSILHSFPQVSVLIWEIFSSDIEDVFMLFEEILFT